MGRLSISRAVVCAFCATVAAGSQLMAEIFAAADRGVRVRVLRQTMACANDCEPLTCAWDKRVSLQTNSFECETRVVHTFNSASKTRL